MRYVWQTLVFTGKNQDEATAAFDTWFGYGIENFQITRQRIRRQADGSLYLYITHVPQRTRYEIHVTALVQMEESP